MLERRNDGERTNELSSRSPFSGSSGLTYCYKPSDEGRTYRGNETRTWRNRPCNLWDDPKLAADKYWSDYVSKLIETEGVQSRENAVACSRTSHCARSLGRLRINSPRHHARLGKAPKQGDTTEIVRRTAGVCRIRRERREEGDYRRSDGRGSSMPRRTASCPSRAVVGRA